MLRRLQKWIQFEKVDTVAGVRIFKLRGRCYAFYIEQGIPWVDEIKNKDIKK